MNHTPSADRRGPGDPHRQHRPRSGPRARGLRAADHLLRVQQRYGRLPLAAEGQGGAVPPRHPRSARRGDLIYALPPHRPGKVAASAQRPVRRQDLPAGAERLRCQFRPLSVRDGSQQRRRLRAPWRLDYARPNSFEARYEDLMEDVDTTLFAAAAAHLGFDDDEVATCRQVFWDHALFGGKAKRRDKSPTSVRGAPRHGKACSTASSARPSPSGSPACWSSSATSRTTHGWRGCPTRLRPERIGGRRRRRPLARHQIRTRSSGAT